MAHRPTLYQRGIANAQTITGNKHAVRAAALTGRKVSAAGVGAAPPGRLPPVPVRPGSLRRGRPTPGRPVPKHPLERWTCTATMGQRPLTYPNPAPFNEWRVGQRLSDWLTNVVYWKLYLAQGAPIQIDPAVPLHQPWVAVWNRIHHCVVAYMGRKGITDETRRPRFGAQRPGPLPPVPVRPARLGMGGRVQAAAFAGYRECPPGIG